ncbi:MAG: hypothetical protein ACPL3C_08680 [Pyrobaculum sp.]
MRLGDTVFERPKIWGLEELAMSFRFPRRYRTIGRVRDYGFDVALDHVVAWEWSWESHLSDSLTDGAVEKNVVWLRVRHHAIYDTDVRLDVRQRIALRERTGGSIYTVYTYVVASPVVL